MEILKRLEGIIADAGETFTLFEFGCCDGYHSNIMLDLLSKSGKRFNYHGFEPVHELFSKINLVYNRDRGIAHLWNKAIGEKNGVVQFFKSDGFKIEDGVVKDHYYGSSSIRKPKIVTDIWKDMTFDERTVECTSLDNHMDSFGISSTIIHFIWADIQGAEVDLINGGRDTFENVKYLYTEYGGSGYYEGEIGIQGIKDMLPDFEVVEDYGGDVLLLNKRFNQ
jgi:FkbM family methyltransferase